MDLKTAAEIADHVVTAAAVVIGGTWAYFRFVRGRTFKHRAELSSSLALTDSAGQRHFIVTVGLKNTGLSKLPLNKDMKAIRLFGAPRKDTGETGQATWKRIATYAFFDQHGWLEPQEEVQDDFLYVLPKTTEAGVPFTAYQVEAIVGSKPSAIRRKKTRWVSRTILVLPNTSLAEEATPIHHET